MQNRVVEVTAVHEYSEELAAGLGALLPALSDRLRGEPIPEERLRQILDSPDRDQFVAKLHGRVVGAATLNLIVGLAGSKAWLEDFVVSEDADVRGKGVGFALWQELMGWCEERQVDLEFTSGDHRNEAHTFYRRQGAQIRETTVFYALIQASNSE